MSADYQPLGNVNKLYGQQGLISNESEYRKGTEWRDSVNIQAGILLGCKTVTIPVLSASHTIRNRIVMWVSVLQDMDNWGKGQNLTRNGLMRFEGRM